MKWEEGIMPLRWDMRDKTPQQQAIVAAKDRNSSIIKNYSSSNILNSILIYPVAIFMKLGWERTGNFDGFKTLEEYRTCITEKGATWFSTNALCSGMAVGRREELKKAINNGKRVYIYFVIGNSGGGENNIEYRAEVIDLESVKGGMKTPDVNITPDLWTNEISTIWIKIKNLHKHNTKRAEDFQFVSNEKNLSEVLRSNCCFGYITEI